MSYDFQILNNEVLQITLLPVFPSRNTMTATTQTLAYLPLPPTQTPRVRGPPLGQPMGVRSRPRKPAPHKPVSPVIPMSHDPVGECTVALATGSPSPHIPVTGPSCCPFLLRRIGLRALPALRLPAPRRTRPAPPVLRVMVNECWCLICPINVPFLSHSSGFLIAP